MPEALPTIPGGQGHVLNGEAVAAPTTWVAGGQLRVGPPQLTVTLGGGRLTLTASSLVTLTVESGNLCFQIDDGSGSYTGSEEVAQGSTMSVESESELGFEEVESFDGGSGEGGLDRDFGSQNQEEDDDSDGFQTSTIKYRLRSIRVRTGARKTPTSQPRGTVSFSYRASTSTYDVSSTGIGFELYVDGSPTTTKAPGQSSSGLG
ncbi:MAG: hypothetical protein ACOYON_05000 [Fimbriimonas sp.]